MNRIIVLKKDFWIVPYLLFFLIFYSIAILNNQKEIEEYIKIIEALVVIQLLTFFTIYFYINDVNTFFSKSYNNFFIMVVVFHLGVPISNVFGYSNIYFEQQLYWYNNINTFNSIISVIVFVNFYILCGLLTFKVSEKKSQDFSKNLIAFNYLVLLISSLSWIFTIYFILGIKQYNEFYETQSVLFTIVFTYLTVIINISFLISIISSYKVKISLATFLVWSIFAFDLGVRGPALYPLAIGTAILVTRGIFKINFGRLLLGMVFFLSILSYKFLERINLDVNNVIDPWAAIQEMGGTLRPVYEVNAWINQGLNFYLGRTYYAPFERAINSMFFLNDNVPATADDRLMNVLIVSKAGPYGFSIIAEAFINFANFGVVLIAFLSGIFFKFLDSKIVEGYINPILIVIGYGFFYHIRQAFVSTFGVVVVSIIYVCVIFFISKLLTQMNYSVK